MTLTKDNALWVGKQNAVINMHCIVIKGIYAPMFMLDTR